MNMPAAEFKSHCLAVMDRVNKTHEPVVITRRGKPLVKLVPVPALARASLFGFMKGTVLLNGDITVPLNESWNAENGKR